MDMGPICFCWIAGRRKYYSDDGWIDPDLWQRGCQAMCIDCGGECKTEGWFQSARQSMGLSVGSDEAGERDRWLWLKQGKR